jgi:hypothetical protein
MPCRTTASTLAVILFLLCLQTGCIAAFAPTVRSDQVGAPGRVGPDQGQAHAAISYWAGFALAGGGGIGMPLGKDWHIEAGASASPWWVLGHTGLRKTFRRKDFDGHGWVGDVGLGGGMGVGGSAMGLNFTLPWTDLFSGGGYADAGVGFRIRKVATPFLRGRCHVSGAQLIGPTVWWEATGGVEFYPSAEHFAVFVAGTWGGFVSSWSSATFGSANLGISVMFDVRKDKGE